MKELIYTTIAAIIAFFASVDFVALIE